MTVQLFIVYAYTHQYSRENQKYFSEIFSNANKLLFKTPLDFAANNHVNPIAGNLV